MNNEEIFKKLNEKEIEACKKLLDYIGYNTDDETIKQNLSSYLTINVGKDKKTYAYYFDENHELICDVDTLVIIDDGEEIKKIMYI